MTRFAVAAVLVLTALAFLLPSVQSSNQSQMAAQIAALEMKVATLEANQIPSSDIAIWAGAGDPNRFARTIDPKEIVPYDPALTLDLVCAAKPTIVDGAGVQEGFETLRCVKYQRADPAVVGGP